MTLHPHEIDASQKFPEPYFGVESVQDRGPERFFLTNHVTRGQSSAEASLRLQSGCAVQDCTGVECQETLT